MNSEKKKILLLIDSLSSGGAQRQLVTLAANIDRDKYEPVVVIYHDLRHFQNILDEARVPVVCINKKSVIDLFFFIKLRRFIRSFSPDIILSYLNTPNMWARLAGYSLCRHIVTSERNIDIVHSSIRVLTEKVLHKRSSTIVVNAGSIAKLLSEKVGIPRQKLHVIYNGVDADQYQKPKPETIKDLKSEFGFRDNDIIITLAGRISEQKNHQCLVLAFAELADQYPSSRLLFVGQIIDVSLHQALLAMIDEKGLSNRILFAGQRTCMSEIYALSHIVVLPSLWEGFPNVVMESMAAAKPVIASDIADNSQLVKDGATGFLFPSGDYIALADRLDMLLSMDEAQRKIMGESGAQHIADNFSVERFVLEYETLFNDLPFQG